MFYEKRNFSLISTLNFQCEIIKYFLNTAKVKSLAQTRLFTPNKLLSRFSKGSRRL